MCLFVYKVVFPEIMKAIKDLKGITYCHYSQSLHTFHKMPDPNLSICVQAYQMWKNISASI